MQGRILLALLMGGARIGVAQTPGHFYRGNGPPVASTNLHPPIRPPPPTGSPNGGPTQGPISALAPISAQLPALAPALETYFNGSHALGQCYCSQVPPRNPQLPSYQWALQGRSSKPRARLVLGLEK
jgi:hypothetical protein